MTKVSNFGELFRKNLTYFTLNKIFVRFLINLKLSAISKKVYINIIYFIS